jgi:hypothetical protein
VIPDLDGATGHLPPGRYRATYEQVKARFCDHPDFVGSQKRARLWEGFERYLTAWFEVEDQLGSRLLLAVWLGGSYMSAKEDPDDLDIAVVIDRDALDAADGRDGVGTAKKLMKNRTKCLSVYGVEPHPVRWVRLATPWGPDAQTLTGRDYYNDRGTLDDWMQRCPSSDVKVAPVPEDAWPARGYLEVELYGQPSS